MFDFYCVVGIMEFYNLWIYRNIFISMDYMWLGRDFYKYFYVLKIEFYLNLGNVVK